MFPRKKIKYQHRIFNNLMPNVKDNVLQKISCFLSLFLGEKTFPQNNQ